MTPEEQKEELRQHRLWRDALAGDPRCQMWMAEAFQKGMRGVDPDLEIAYYLLAEPAGRGIQEAINKLNALFSQNPVNQPDPATVFRSYQKLTVFVRQHARDSEICANRLSNIETYVKSISPVTTARVSSKGKRFATYESGNVIQVMRFG